MFNPFSNGFDNGNILYQSMYVGELKANWEKYAALLKKKRRDNNRSLPEEKERDHYRLMDGPRTWEDMQQLASTLSPVNACTKDASDDYCTCCRFVYADDVYEIHLGKSSGDITYMAWTCPSKDFS